VTDRIHPRTGHEGQDGGGWSTPRLGRFTPGKETRYPLYRKLGGPQGRSGRVRKISPPTGMFFVHVSFSFFPFCPFYSLCSLISSVLMPLISLQHTTHASMPPAGFELAIPSSYRPQILALDLSATGMRFEPWTVQPLYRLRYPGPRWSQ
jgi:hypothetical protein